MKERQLLGISAAVAATLLVGLKLYAAGLPGEHQEDTANEKPSPVAFTPPDESQLPDDAFGKMVREGKELFVHTKEKAPKYVGNDLSCANCHLDQGRHANSAPLWGAYVKYPAFRKKTGRVDSYEERLQGCFRYSMNGTAPPAGSRELNALVTYSYWLATGAPVGQKLQGAGYPELPKPVRAPDVAAGGRVYAQNCAVCHGANGEGTKTPQGQIAFPPLWGPKSFNWGAGMHRTNTAAGFIKANMPLGKPNSLSDQEAWDAAAFVTSHERPPDPRFKGSLAETKKHYHDENCYYGETANGKKLGEGLRQVAGAKAASAR